MSNSIYFTWTFCISRYYKRHYFNTKHGITSTYARTVLLWGNVYETRCITACCTIYTWNMSCHFLAPLEPCKQVTEPTRFIFIIGWLASAARAALISLAKSVLLYSSWRPGYTGEGSKAWMMHQNVWSFGMSHTVANGKKLARQFFQNSQGCRACVSTCAGTKNF